MSPTPTPGPVKPHHQALDEFGALRALVDAMKTRVVSGLILALPIALTFWIIYQLYLALNNAVLGPASRGVRWLLGFRAGFDSDGVWAQVVSPLIAIGLALGLLYILGLLARSGVRRAIDWVLLHLPIVTTIYKALSNVFQSLEAQRQGNMFQRVVLVDFPHPGSKALAFVTRTLADAATGKAILCVCVLTGVVPPSGFTLYVPEEDVTDVDWTVNQALQAILSGGITTPSVIHFTRGIVVPPTGPIVDPAGHPISSDPTNHDPAG
jgi:uncharacterized membrane protein